MDCGGGADLLVRLKAALALHEVRGEDGVDQGRLAETCLAWNGDAKSAFGSPYRQWLKLTDANNIELEAPLHRLPLNLLGDAVETDIALGVDGLCRVLVCSSHCGRCEPRRQMVEQKVLRVRKLGLWGGGGDGGCCRRVNSQGGCAGDFLAEVQARKGQPRSEITLVAIRASAA